ncbi:hypothetical protein OBBRIDRAFT_791916 [Obba rivulosa]|uniref:F-box domain-containing protein n=1 Tax=Obba rivulosa TaxID=1052685 RepID=A0A8E2DM78_9APHY|nr:hypothetical protein OBBRIDRAFT_791916 [Obba rivulosa]
MSLIHRQVTAGRSAAHRCLVVHETFQKIVEELQGLEGPRKTTLASLARTCRTFHHFAEPMLWQELPSILPLLRKLPKGQWTQIADECERSVFTFVPGAKIHLVDLKPYSEWVQRLNCRINLHEDVYIYSMNILASLCRVQGALCPKLRHLLWHEHRRDYASFLDVLAPSSLRSLHIMTPASLSYHCPDITEGIHDVDHYQYLFPHLEDLSVRYFYGTLDMFDHPRWSLLPSDRLKRLAVTSRVSAVSLLALSRLPNLSHMDIRTDCTALGATLRNLPALDAPCFPVLRSLRLALDLLNEDVIAFFGKIKQSYLEDLTIIALGATSGRNLRSFFEACASGTYGLSLRSLRVHISTRDSVPGWQEVPDPRVEQPYTVVFDTLKPLLKMPNLEDIGITFAYTILDVHSLRKLACGLPRLTSLHISTDLDMPAGYIISPRVPLDALRIFADRSEQLRSLSLTMHAAMPPTPLPAHWLSRSRVRELSVGDSAIYSAEKVATYLIALFPDLRGVKYSPRARGDESFHEMERRARAWLKVNRLLLNRTIDPIP